jgi:hypothetical protein
MVAASLLVGCYTDPINMRPNVSIALQSDPIFRGGAAMFTATASDPNGDAVSYWWATTEEPCPADATAESNWPSASSFILRDARRRVLPPSHELRAVGRDLERRGQ